MELGQQQLILMRAENPRQLTEPLTLLIFIIRRPCPRKLKAEYGNTAALLMSIPSAHFPVGWSPDSYIRFGTSRAPLFKAGFCLKTKEYS